MGKFDPNYSNREYNYLCSLTKSIVTKAGQDTYHFREFDQLKDRTVVGVRVRRNSHNSNAPKKDKRGRPIIGNDALMSAHITLYDQNNNKVLDEEPLEYFSYDTFEHEIGAFNQFCVNSIDTSESEICFGDVGDVKDGEVLQVTLMYLHDCLEVIV